MSEWMNEQLFDLGKLPISLRMLLHEVARVYLEWMDHNYASGIVGVQFNGPHGPVSLGFASGKFAKELCEYLDWQSKLHREEDSGTDSGSVEGEQDGRV